MQIKNQKLKIKNGFTLVEVMVAVVVLGIGISSILALIGQTTKAVGVARGITIQTALARLAMVEIENQYWNKKADEVDNSGDFGNEFPDYRYKVEIIEDIDEKIPTLHEVILTVYWDRKMYEREFKLTTFLLDRSK